MNYYRSSGCPHWKTTSLTLNTSDVLQQETQQLLHVWGNKGKTNKERTAKLIVFTLWAKQWCPGWVPCVTQQVEMDVDAGPAGGLIPCLAYWLGQTNTDSFKMFLPKRQNRKSGIHRGEYLCVCRALWEWSFNTLLSIQPFIDKVCVCVCVVLQNETECEWERQDKNPVLLHSDRWFRIYRLVVRSVCMCVCVI